MIFYYLPDGSQVGLTPKKIYQGSNKASSIYFICPTSKENVVSVAFTLPNGKTTELYPMSLTENFSFPVGEDLVANCWSIQLTSEITSEYGNITVQFFISGADGEVTATASSTFFVERGVPVVEIEKGDSYLELVNKILELQDKMKDYATADAELSETSTNPVQNKVITEALDGKVDKIEPSISTNPKNYVYTRKRFGKSEGSRIEDYLYEVSGSAIASTIVSRGAGGAIRIGEPQSEDMAVNLGYMNENVGHKYRFTANMNGFFEDGSILYFDYDCKGEKDIETISTEIIGKTVTLLGNDGSGDDRNLVYGAMRVVTATVSGNALSIPLTNCFVTVRSNYESMTMAMAGTYTFTMEQIY